MRVDLDLKGRVRFFLAATNIHNKMARGLQVTQMSIIPVFFTLPGGGAVHLGFQLKNSSNESERARERRQIGGHGDSVGAHQIQETALPYSQQSNFPLFSLFPLDIRYLIISYFFYRSGGRYVKHVYVKSNLYLCIYHYNIKKDSIHQYQNHCMQTDFSCSLNSK